MWRLALPVLAEELLTLMVTWTDWWLTGHFLSAQGDSAKAAMGLMGYTMWLIPALFASVSIGATALIARWVGAGAHESARHAANQAVLLGLLLAAACTSVFWWGAGAYVSAMQLRGEAAELANQYLEIVVLVIPLIMFEQVGAACLRGAGDMFTGFVAKSVVVLVNIGVSASLVTGFAGMPWLGWQGLAVGTACGHAAGGLILLTALLRGRAGMKLGWALMGPNRPIIAPLLRIGLPGGVDIAAILVSQLCFVALINRLGESAAAAHGLAVQIEACAYLPGVAFQVAAATMAGQFLGAGQPQRAQRGVLTCLLAGLAVICTAGAVLFFFGHWFTWFFTGNWHGPTTIAAAQLLRIVAFGMPSLAAVMILSGGFRGAGDTRWPLLFTLIGFFALRIPLAVWLAFPAVPIPLLQADLVGLGWGVQGAWCAMVVDLLVRSLLVVQRFARGSWMRIKI